MFGSSSLQGNIEATLEGQHSKRRSVRSSLTYFPPAIPRGARGFEVIMPPSPNPYNVKSASRGRGRDQGFTASPTAASVAAQDSVYTVCSTLVKLIIAD